MIIGKNNPNNNLQGFNTKMNAIKENAQVTRGTVSPIATNNNTLKHSNVLSKDEMNDKAFNMLQERLNNGLITIEEFNKKCTELGKRYK